MVTATSNAPFQIVQIVRFREPRRVQPSEAIPNFEPGVLDRHNQPVMRAGTAEREQMRAGLEHAKHFAPGGRVERDAASVPCLTHKIEFIRRISDARVDRIRVERFQDFPAVASV